MLFRDPRKQLVWLCRKQPAGAGNWPEGQICSCWTQTWPLVQWEQEDEPEEAVVVPEEVSPLPGSKQRGLLGSFHHTQISIRLDFVFFLNKKKKL